MARDLTKYGIIGTTDFVGKGKLALKAVESYISNYGVVSLERLQEIFPDEIQGRVFVREVLDVVKNGDSTRFHKDVIDCSSGSALVSNQWGAHNIQALLDLCVGINVDIFDNKSSIEDSSSISKENNYTEFFEEQPFDDTIKHFIEKTSAELKKYSWESEDDCDLVYDLFEELKEITKLTSLDMELSISIFYDFGRNRRRNFDHVDWIS